MKVQSSIPFRFLAAAVLLAGISLSGCTNPHAPDIDGLRARDLVRNGALLVDVRSSLEFWWSHNEGAVNIPYSELGEKMKTFDRTRAIVVYSRSGIRSAKAKVLLTSAGFRAYDLGGKQNWEH